MPEKMGFDTGKEESFKDLIKEYSKNESLTEEQTMRLKQVADRDKELLARALALMDKPNRLELNAAMDTHYLAEIMKNDPKWTARVRKTLEGMDSK